MGRDRLIRIWSAENGEQVRELPISVPDGETNSIYPLAYSQDGKQIATAAGYGRVYVWNLMANEAPLHSFEAHSGGVQSVAFVDDDRLLVTGGFHRINTQRPGTLPVGQSFGECRFWKIADGSQTGDLQADDPNQAGRIVVASEDGRTICWYSGKEWKLADVRNGEVVFRVSSKLEFFPDPSNQSVALSPDKKILATYDGHQIQLWNTESGQAHLADVGAHTGVITTVQYSPDGHSIATGSSDGTVRLWNPKSGKQLFVCNTGTGRNTVGSLAFSPDGNVLYVQSFDHSAESQVRSIAIVYNAKNGLKEREMELGANLATEMVLSADGNLLAASGYRQTPSASTQTGATSPGAKGRISREQFLSIWNTQTGRKLAEMVDNSSQIRNVCFLADNKTVVTVHKDRVIKLWDVASAQEIQQFEVSGHLAPAHGFPGRDGPLRKSDLTVSAFAPQSLLCVTSGSYSDTLLGWDLSSGENTIALRFHGMRDCEFALSPDGKTLAVGYEPVSEMHPDPDSRMTTHRSHIRLWRLDQGIELRNFAVEGETCNVIAFSPDATQLVTGMDPGTAIVWDLIGPSGHPTGAARK